MILTDDEVWSLWNSQGTDDMNMQEAATFARAIESAVLRKLRERPADAWLIVDGADGYNCHKWKPLHIIPEVNE